jgi:hypothetical protein
MRLFKNSMAAIYPGALYLLSTSNEENTEVRRRQQCAPLSRTSAARATQGNIEEMGDRLAAEIDKFVHDNCRRTLGRIRLAWLLSQRHAGRRFSLGPARVAHVFFFAACVAASCATRWAVSLRVPRWRRRAWRRTWPSCTHT